MRQWASAKAMRHYYKHRAKEIARSAAWNEAHPEARKIAQDKWYAKHGREYHARTSAKRVEATRKWQRKNNDKLLQYAATGRAKKRATITNGSHTLAEWRALLDAHDRRCAYCHKPLVGRDATRDHKLPVTRGGSDRIENILPACRSCNSRKRTKTTEEYLTQKAI